MESLFVSVADFYQRRGYQLYLLGFPHVEQFFRAAFCFLCLLQFTELVCQETKFLLIGVSLLLDAFGQRADSDVDGFLVLLRVQPVVCRGLVDRFRESP